MDIPFEKYKGQPTTWKILGASVAGTAHLRLNFPCQDCQESRELSAGAFAIAVADGAGSARYADDGASEAVSAILAYLAAKSTALVSITTPEQARDLLSQAIGSARSRVISLASVRTHDSYHATLMDFATTLLIALLLPEMLATAQLGDGVIVTRHPNGEFRALPSEKSRFANETTFLTSLDFQTHVRYECTPSEHVNGVALLTDGLQPLAMQPTRGAPYTGFFAPLFAFASQPDATTSELLDFLESERVNARTDDDKTLVLAVRD